MKKTRLFILICAMLISFALVGCGNKDNTSETELTEFETETQIETELQHEGERQNIKATLAVKHSKKEISVYSDESCFFTLKVDICDCEFISQNSYGEFQIIAGETLTLTIEDLAADFFSDKATIEKVYIYTPHVYGDSPIAEENYTRITNDLLIKHSKNEITVYSDKTCLIDLCLYIGNSDFYTINDFRKLEISEGETITFTLDDLAPDFFPQTAIIKGYDPYECTSYVENKN